MSRKRNPYKKVLRNAQGGQNLNQYQKERGINRKVKEVSVTEEDIKRILAEQGGKSASLKIPIYPEDVFRTHFPLAPSLDRIDNNRGYTPDNVRINTRFENWGFNKASPEVIEECIVRLLAALEYIRSGHEHGETVEVVSNMLGEEICISTMEVSQQVVNESNSS